MGLFKSVGKLFNDVTGATSAAELNNSYQKEFAQNQVQWRADDLDKAGFNRILAAGGEGANAGGAGGATSAGGVQLPSIETITNSAETLAKLGAEIKNIESQTDVNNALTGKHKAEEKNINTDTRQRKGTKEYWLGGLGGKGEELANRGLKTLINSAKTLDIQEKKIAKKLKKENGKFNKDMLLGE